MRDVIAEVNGRGDLNAVEFDYDFKLPFIYNICLRVAKEVFDVCKRKWRVKFKNRLLYTFLLLRQNPNPAGQFKASFKIN